MRSLSLPAPGFPFPQCFWYSLGLGCRGAVLRAHCSLCCPSVASCRGWHTGHPLQRSLFERCLFVRLFQMLFLPSACLLGILRAVSWSVWLCKLLLTIQKWILDSLPPPPKPSFSFRNILLSKSSQSPYVWVRTQLSSFLDELVQQHGTLPLGTLHSVFKIWGMGHSGHESGWLSCPGVSGPDRLDRSLEQD